MQIRHKSEFEFTIVMAALMSLAALAIDALLPALNQIGDTIGVVDSKNNQLLITMIFLGLGFGQLVSGPLSDSIGRKPVIYFGYVIFVMSSFICVFSTNLEMMIVGRVLQGIGLSAPRTISIAIVRDRFSGDRMAKVMSFVTAIFILVPVVAPTFGQLMLNLFGWEAIFYSQLIFGLFVVLWLWRRQPETLKDENKRPLKLSMFIDGFKEFLKHKDSVVFTIIAGLVMSAFMVYLSSSQQMFQEQYGLVDEFPYIFAGLACGVGISTFLNGTFVMKFGMLKLTTIFMIAITILSTAFVFIYLGKSNPSITVLIIFTAILLFFIGFIFGNVSALAMQPVGHIAGIGSAIFGFVSTVMAVPVATFIGSFISVSVLPFFAGFSICGSLCLLLMLYLRVGSKKAAV
jgi:DHA1 family bicyclomycin/chloramphenicol resistance-like MFS transporter